MDRILKDKKAIFLFVFPGTLLFTLVLVIPVIQVLYY